MAVSGFGLFWVVEGSFDWLWVVLVYFGWFWVVVCFTTNVVKGHKHQQKEYQPIKMEVPYTKDKLIKVVTKVKNSKSSGSDNVQQK